MQITSRVHYLLTLMLSLLLMMMTIMLLVSSGLGPKTGPGIFQLGQPTQFITTVLLLIRPPDIEMSEGLKREYH